jgi:hypothetical protein
VVVVVFVVVIEFMQPETDHDYDYDHDHDHVYDDVYEEPVSDLPLLDFDSELLLGPDFELLSELEVSLLLDESLLDSLLGLFDRFEGPEYRSDSQPPPLRMKPPPPIIRRAFSFPHLGHFLIAFSVMRCSRSNSCPQLSQV